MSGRNSYDSNHDGFFSGSEADRWQLDNGGYPGQFENEGEQSRATRSDNQVHIHSAQKYIEKQQRNDHAKNIILAVCLGIIAVGLLILAVGSSICMW